MNPSFSHRVTTCHDPSYTDEADCIRGRAEQRVTCIVRLGPMVFFSTATGDAWMLDANDGEAACLARDGETVHVTIHESASRFAVEWQGRYRLEGDSFTFLANDGGAQTIDGYPVGEIRRLVEEHPLEQPRTTAADGAAHERLQRTGRNDPCPCGSGKKYKKCCLPKDELAARNPAGGSSLPAVRRAELDSAPPESDDSDDDGYGEAFDPDEEGEDDVIDIEPAAGAAAATGSGAAKPATDDPDEPGLTPEVEAAVDAVWEEFNHIEDPTAEQMMVHLERLISLPPEATLWNELFHQFIKLKHDDLPGVFRRIAAGVRPTPGASLGFFYWAAIEAFVKRRQYEFVPEVVAGFRTLDLRTYDADALDHVQLWAMAAGCEAEALALVEQFFTAVRADDGLMPYAASDEGRLLFELRVGGRLREPTARGADPAVLAGELRCGLESEIHADHARRAAEVICGVAPVRVVTRHDFDLPLGEVQEKTPEWVGWLACLEVLMYVAREAWEEERRLPGIGFRGLQSLVDAVYGDLDDRPSKLKRAPLNLLDCLQPSGMERRVVRQTRGIMGTNLPKAHLLLEAHSDLLRYAARHRLIEDHFATKSERNLARLKAELGFPG